jgi:glutathione S-transferase
MPPNGKPRRARPLTLITFPLSHFCEKARWGLDHAGVTYRERGYPPAVHKLAVLPHRASTVPLLVGNPTLRESTDILAFANRACRDGNALYPATADARRETDALVARLDAVLGPHVRVWFYAWALAEPRRLRAWASPGLPRRQRAVLDAMAPAIAALIANRLEVNEATGAQARERVDEELEMVSAKLADGRRYLAGDRFGAADLTFAALSGPALLAPGYGGGSFIAPPMPAQLEAQIEAWRATPAGQHALRVYREHRRASEPPHA